MENFRSDGLKSMKVLQRNLTNTRYLGFSEFYSSNTLRNSHYAWSVPKSLRLNPKQFLKLNDNIYNMPTSISNRFTIMGYGERKDLRPTYCRDTPSPDAYLIKSVFDTNKAKKKGYSMGLKLDNNLIFKHKTLEPGPSEYNITFKAKKHGNIPIKLKSRQGFFYDDDLKHKKATVSMQRYKPKYNLVQRNRFKAITFGIGSRPPLHNTCEFPGPGSYHVPGCFDRGLKGKLALN